MGAGSGVRPETVSRHCLCGTLADGSSFSGVLTNRIGTGYPSLDGFGFSLRYDTETDVKSAAELQGKEEMTALNTLSIAIELRVAVAIMLGLLATLALFALSRLSVVEDESATISGNWLPGVCYAGAMDADISDCRIGLLQYIAAVEPAQTAMANKNMADAQANFKKDSAQFAKLIKSEKERALFDKFNGAFTRYQAAAQSVAALALKSLNNDSVERVQNGTVLLDRASQTIQNIVGSVQRLADLVGEISSASREQSSGISQESTVPLNFFYSVRAACRFKKARQTRAARAVFQRRSPTSS